MTFIPVKPARTKSARKLELPGRVTFPATRQPWSLKPDTVKSVSAMVVDTNGDLTPETPIPGTSNFLAGHSPEYSTTDAMCSCCPGEYCHADDGEQHCTYVEMCPGSMSCC